MYMHVRADACVLAQLNEAGIGHGCLEKKDSECGLKCFFFGSNFSAELIGDNRNIPKLIFKYRKKCWAKAHYNKIKF